MVSFNVLREPWIPAVDHEGQPHDLGILGVLRQAHELAEIIDPSPPIEYGIHRLLVAFVMDAFDIQELEDIEYLLGAGSFDIERINAYIDAAEMRGQKKEAIVESSAYRGVFQDLDPRREFLQRLRRR